MNKTSEVEKEKNTIFVLVVYIQEDAFLYVIFFFYLKC